MKDFLRWLFGSALIFLALIMGWCWPFLFGYLLGVGLVSLAVYMLVIVGEGVVRRMRL